MKVTFVLPGSGHKPVGGFKVVYEYANGLALLGHDVTVVHPTVLETTPRLRARPLQLAKYLLRRVTQSYRPTDWFELSPDVRVVWVPSLRSGYIPAGDAIVATAWQTAEIARDYPATKGEKFYLVQHVEAWSGPRERVLATWKEPLHKVVIAKWLLELAHSMGQDADYIPNGLDFRKFAMDVEPEDRVPSKVLMMYHEYEWKGSHDGLEALDMVKRQHNALEVTLFGVFPRPPDLPDWIAYHRNPEQSTLKRLYNEAAIFLAPSWTEGWPLPPAEAMASGAALVATDIGGHREYAFDDVTALLCDAKDSETMAACVLRLVRDSNARVNIARAGHEYIQRFRWDTAVRRFANVLSAHVERSDRRAHH